MKDLKAIDKTRSGQGINYKFRGISDYQNELHPLMAKYEVVSIPEVLHRGAEYFEKSKEYNGNVTTTRWTQVVLTMQWKFLASDGSFVTVGPVIAEGLDSSDKATNKAMSVAFKYALEHLFMVPTQDTEEPEETRPEVTEEKPKAKLKNYAPQTSEAAKEASKDPKISPNQINELKELMKQAVVTRDEVIDMVKMQWGKESVQDLACSEYFLLANVIKSGQFKESYQMAKSQKGVN
jgi:hypothetical protein